MSGTLPVTSRFARRPLDLSDTAPAPVEDVEALAIMRGAARRVVIEVVGVSGARPILTLLGLEVAS